MHLGSVAQVQRWDDLTRQASATWGVPLEWIQAVIEVESGGNPDAFNPEGSRGLMQIYEPTARAYGVEDLEALFDPAYNIGVGSHLLADLRRSYGDDFRRVYSAYNSGGPDKWEWSNQVARNVGKALTALETFTARGGPEAPILAAAPSVPLLAVGIGLLWGLSRKPSRRRR